MIYVDKVSVTNGGTLQHPITSQDQVLVIFAERLATPSVAVEGVVVPNLITATFTDHAASPSTWVATVSYLVNPRVGSLSITGGANTRVAAITLSGVNKKVSLPPLFSATGTGNPAMSVNAAAANTAILDFTAYGDDVEGTNATGFPNLGQSGLFNQSNNVLNNLGASLTYLNPSEPQTIGWTTSGPATIDWAYVAIALEPAQAPSFWSPSVGNRFVTDYDGQPMKLTAGLTIANVFGNTKPTNFWKNSFLHTVGRILPAPPVSAPSINYQQTTSQIVIDKITSATFTATASIQHTVTSADAVLVVMGEASVAMPTFAVNGTPLTIVSTVANGTTNAYIGYMVNPPVGSITIASSVSANVITMTALSILGVNKAVTRPVFATGTAAAASINTPIQVAQANSLVIDVLGDTNLDNLAPFNTEQHPIFGASVSGVIVTVGSFRLASPGTQTMGWVGATGTLAQAIIVLEPAHSPSMWFPVIDTRSINDVTGPNALDTTNLGVSGQQYNFGNYASNFWQNSFLHTIGRVGKSSSTTNLLSLVAASVSFSGAQTKQTNYPLSAALSFVGSLTKQTLYPLSAAISFVGSIAKTSGKALSGSLSFSGTISRLTKWVRTASLSFVGNLNRFISYPLSASLSFVGSLTKKTFYPLSASLSFVGNFVGSHLAFQSFTAAISFSAAITKKTLVNRAAALSFSGSLNKLTAYPLSAAMSLVGSLAKRTSVPLSGALSFVGSFTSVALILRTFTAAISFSGAMTKRTGRGLSASLSFSGSFAKRIARGLVATVSFSTVFTAVKGHVPVVYTQLITATVSFIGNFAKIGSVHFTPISFIINTIRPTKTLNQNPDTSTINTVSTNKDINDSSVDTSLNTK